MNPVLRVFRQIFTPMYRPYTDDNTTYYRSNYESELMHEINELDMLLCRRMKGYPGHMYIPGESADASDDRYYVVLKFEKTIRNVSK